MPNETIIAVFDTAAHAERAMQDLVAADVPAGSIERHDMSGTETASRAGANATAPRPGFWRRLLGAEPETDTGAYDRSIERGATVVSVRPTAERLDDVIAILEGHHPLDMDERDAEPADPTPTTGFVSEAIPTSRPDADPVARVASDGLSASRRVDAELPLDVTSDRASGRAGDQVETVALSAEALSVDKRVIHRGGTRVRRYVVETPVEERVSLRGEHVTVERRAVEGVRAPGAGSFTERAMEMIETDEVPVVIKNARVVEEVSLRKEATTRTETVRDTLRREDVALERVADRETGPR